MPFSIRVHRLASLCSALSRTTRLGDPEKERHIDDLDPIGYGVVRSVPEQVSSALSVPGLA